MNRQVMRKLHLLLSLPMGIIFFLLCITGAPLTFKNEIRDALNMPHVVGSHHGDRVLSANETAEKDFLSYLQQFHKSLMMGKTGKYIVTYSTIACTIILITGIGESWPEDWEKLKRRLRIKKDKGRTVLWHDIHTALGYWVAIWLLLICVTGIMIGFHLYDGKEGRWLMHLVLDLHTGRWGGTATKIITFVTSVIGATLPLSGYYIFFRKRIRKTKNHK